MMNTRIVDEFIHNGRKCVVTENQHKVKTMDGKVKVPAELQDSTIFKPWCNGYIEIFSDEDKLHYNDFDVPVELTFKGDLKNKGNFIGFDTMHYWNDLNPESKKPQSVAKACIDVAKALDKQKNEHNNK